MTQIIETLLQLVQISSNLAEAFGNGTTGGHWLPLVAAVAELLLFAFRLPEIDKHPARHSTRHRNKRHARAGRGRHSERR
ncbi:hypothetical protein GFD17_10210 [Bifidobacterium sp. SMB2]|uniref:Uncharacterized protein n=1 Tax=Bifidobacterium saimiriisciurei TaxID=2661627 RepID=A0ABX0CEE6_9BIFI|nr:MULTISPECIES: hypothetical protein [Bifidobacterium]NEG97114.1 hypothetical protein [Bifidobacterium sp. SMB2]NEH12561.1 hypothetical protein [Bifidobacterium saimiriisciurei]